MFTQQIRKEHSMKPSELIQALFYAAKANRPTIIWGDPGIGKSHIVYHVAKKLLKKKLYEFRATLLDPVDLRGLMEIKNGRTVWAPPIFLPTKPNGVLFIDELPTAPPLVQAALYQLVWGGKLGEYELPEDTIIICAGNNENNRAAVNRMPTPLANRFIHLFLEVSFEEWIEWAIQNGLAIEVIAFIRFRQALLSTFDPKNLEKAFASPRSWEFASDIIKQKPRKDILIHLLRGTVGKNVAEELYGFLEDWELLPDPIKIMTHPSKAEIPEKPSVLYAVIQALAKMVNKNTMQNFLEYANRLRENGKSEFAMAMITDALSRDSSLKESSAYIKGWFAKNSDLYVQTR